MLITPLLSANDDFMNAATLINLIRCGLQQSVGTNVEQINKLIQVASRI